MLSATELATVSLEMMPTICDGRQRPSARRHHGHRGLAARHALHHVEHDVVLSRQREVALRDVAEMHSAIGRLDAAPQPGVDPHDTGDAVAARDNDVMEAMVVRMIAAGRRRSRASAGTMVTSRSMTSPARRTRNMLACIAFGTK